MSAVLRRLAANSCKRSIASPVQCALHLRVCVLCAHQWQRQPQHDCPNALIYGSHRCASGMQSPAGRLSRETVRFHSIECVKEARHSARCARWKQSAKRNSLGVRRAIFQNRQRNSPKKRIGSKRSDPFSPR